MNNYNILGVVGEGRCLTLYSVPAVN